MEQIEQVEEVYNDPVVKHSTIGNLETAKRLFFNNDFDSFVKEIKQKPYKLYNCTFKYASDFEGRPEYIARNLNRGLCKEMDDYKKYLMCVFRCYQVGDRVYEYKSQWIVNTNDELSKVLGDRYEDFEWVEVASDSSDSFFEEFKKKQESENLVTEDYVH